MDLYREEILEHWQNPQNFGEMKSADFVFEKTNPLCGDRIKLFIKIKNSKIEDASFVGEGCAISTASASIFSEYIKSKAFKELGKITGEKLLGLLGGKSGFPPARIKCALLPLEAIKRLKIEN